MRWNRRKNPFKDNCIKPEVEWNSLPLWLFRNNYACYEIISHKGDAFSSWNDWYGSLPFKGQMNQNFDMFSLAILWRGNVKKHVKGKLCGNFSFWAVKRSKKVRSTKTADGFTKTFPKWPRTLMEEWNWDSALWRHCCLEHCCVSASASLSWGRFWI